MDEPWKMPAHDPWPAGCNINSRKELYTLLNTERATRESDTLVMELINYVEQRQRYLNETGRRC